MIRRVHQGRKGPPALSVTDDKGGENAMSGYKKGEHALPAPNQTHVHMPTRKVWVRLSLPASASNMPIFWIGAMFGVMMVLMAPRVTR